MEFDRVACPHRQLQKFPLKALRLMATFSPFIEFASSLGQLVVIFFGGRLAYQGILQVSDLVAFFLYLEILYQPIRALSGAWENVQNALAGADRVSELLDEDEEVRDQATPAAYRTSSRCDPFRGCQLFLCRLAKLSWRTSTWISRPVILSPWWDQPGWVNPLWSA